MSSSIMYSDPDVGPTHSTRTHRLPNRAHLQVACDAIFDSLHNQVKWGTPLAEAVQNLRSNRQQWDSRWWPVPLIEFLGDNYERLLDEAEGYFRNPEHARSELMSRLH